MNWHIIHKAYERAGDGEAWTSSIVWWTVWLTAWYHSDNNVRESFKREKNCKQIWKNLFGTDSTYRLKQVSKTRSFIFHLAKSTSTSTTTDNMAQTKSIYMFIACVEASTTSDSFYEAIRVCFLHCQQSESEIWVKTAHKVSRFNKRQSHRLN